MPSGSLHYRVHGHGEGHHLSYEWSLEIKADPGCADGFKAGTPKPNQATWYPPTRARAVPATTRATSTRRPPSAIPGRYRCREGQVLDLHRHVPRHPERRRETRCRRRGRGLQADGEVESRARVGAIEDRLEHLGIELPPPFAPIANFSLTARSGTLLFVSGHGPTMGSEVAFSGRVPSDVSVEEAYRAARLAALNCLRSMQDELGTLDRVTRIVKVLGMVWSDPTSPASPR